MVAALPALALGTAGTAATATAAATAGTAGLFGSAGAFSLMQTISTVGTAFSIGSTLFAGQAQNAANESAARFEAFRADQERTRGKLEAAKIKEDLARELSTSIAVGAAQGIDISSGSPAEARRAAEADANRAYSLARINAENNAGSFEQNAYQLRARGRNAIRSARSRAVGIGTDFLQRQSDRGFAF